MKAKRTLVMGASPDPGRFSHKAVKLLSRKGHDVIPVGRRKGEIGGIPIVSFEEKVPEDVHTLSLYLSPAVQKQFYAYILGLNPRRVIFNPGTENEELEKMLREKGVETVRNCNIQMLLNDIF